MLIRYMEVQDIPQVLAVELSCSQFEDPWTWEDFRDICECSQETNAILAIDGPLVLGYLAYETFMSHRHIESIAVGRRYQRRGVGAAMVNHVQRCVPSVSAMVREYNLTAQQFLRSCGFGCTDVLRDRYDDSDEDAYWFDWSRDAIETYDDGACAALL